MIASKEKSILINISRSRNILSNFSIGKPSLDIFQHFMIIDRDSCDSTYQVKIMTRIRKCESLSWPSRSHRNKNLSGTKPLKKLQNRTFLEALLPEEFSLGNEERMKKTNEQCGQSQKARGWDTPSFPPPPEPVTSLWMGEDRRRL
jgi:hypothetical protein